MSRYLCRICYNTSNWVQPSGAAIEGDTHFGHYGFAYEEWNFDFAFLFDGWKYGWLEGFWAEPHPESGAIRAKSGRSLVPFAVHDVVLYYHHRGEKYLVGRIQNCEHIPQVPPAVKYPGSYLDTMLAQANRQRADIRQTSQGLWEIHPTRPHSTGRIYRSFPMLNIRFRPDDFVPLGNQQNATVPIDYDRYGALLVDNSPRREEIWANIPS